MQLRVCCPRLRRPLPSLEKLLRPHLKQNRPIAGMSSNEDAGGGFDMVGMVRQYYGNYGRGRSILRCVMVLTKKVRTKYSSGIW